MHWCQSQQSRSYATLQYYVCVFFFNAGDNALTPSLNSLAIFLACNYSYKNF